MAVGGESYTVKNAYQSLIEGESEIQLGLEMYGVR
jgi:hypothetical protein